MYLVDSEIEAIGSSIIDTFDPAKVQSTSYDLSLSAELLEPITFLGDVDLRYTNMTNYFNSVSLTSYGYILKSGSSVLGSTHEYFTVPDDMQLQLEGRSTIARMFLVPHVACGGITPGFRGNITLEIVNMGPFDVVLYPEMPIAQIKFLKLSKPVAYPYGSSKLQSKYQGQQGPTTHRKTS